MKCNNLTQNGNNMGKRTGVSVRYGKETLLEPITEVVYYVFKTPLITIAKVSAMLKILQLTNSNYDFKIAEVFVIGHHGTKATPHVEE